MKFSKDEVMQYIREENVKFIRLAFCDVYGRQKNISIMPGELKRAFEQGIAIDASAIPGFGGEVRSDLFLHPDPATLSGLPWRPENGKVVRMFCDISYPGGRPFEADTRSILKKAVLDAKSEGYEFYFGSEMEFYLFKTDENGAPTSQPHDQAGYMDIAPDDRGENVRREICLTLEQMGIRPESSHHEEGPGQNEIDFRYADPVTAADNAVTFSAVVKTIAARNGLFADFSPKPLFDRPGSGMHVNISARSSGGEYCLPWVMSGIMEKIPDMTLFLNPCAQSYDRLGSNKAPRYISWSSENRSQLIRLPAVENEERRVELRSPDCTANPYIAYALLIYAGMFGIRNRLPLPDPEDINLYTAPEEKLVGLKRLPTSIDEAIAASEFSSFISEHLPAMITEAYFHRD